MKRSICAAVIALSLAATERANAKDLLQTAVDAGQFTMLLDAVRRAGLEATLKTPGPFTVFAPTDDAFRALPPEVSQRLMNPANKSELAKVLSYHVLAGVLATGDVKGKVADLKAVSGQSVFVDGQGDAFTANGAKLTQTDIRADNGVIHVLDKVLIPPVPVQPKMTLGGGGSR